MAIALIYCNDPDFQLNQQQIKRFVSACTGMNDELLDFFLFAVAIKPMRISSPYNICSITEGQTPYSYELDGELVYLYTNELISRGLLLPDTLSMIPGNNDSWSVRYGVSPYSVMVERLFNKAHELLAIA
ncbi:hypothetical protein D8S93_24440 [Vibrio sp. VGrn 2]|nr:hypothetical protein [Vibrio sp. VGrn 2]